MLRQLLKGGNYSREETIRGNTVDQKCQNQEYLSFNHPMYHFMFHFMSSLVTWDVVILVFLKTHVWLRDF